MLVKNTLDKYPGFAVEYDTAKNPFFEKICLEALGLINSKPLGVELLDGIASATPGFRGDFMKGVNVTLQPLQNGMIYNQSGFKPVKVFGDGGKFSITGMLKSAHAGHNLKLPNNKGDCRFWKDGTSLNRAVNTSFTDTTGTVCYVGFSNAQFMTSKGESCVAFIVLAHELIHSLHCLTGTHKGEDEEIATAGQGKYADDLMTESAFRVLFGLPVRAAY